jgi:hypothetical protein
VCGYPCASTFSKAGEEGNLLSLHPTVKSVAMVDCLRKFKAAGGLNNPAAITKLGEACYRMMFPVAKPRVPMTASRLGP